LKIEDEDEEDDEDEDDEWPPLRGTLGEAGDTVRKKGLSFGGNLKKIAK